MKRIAIYNFYNKRGVVEDYVRYFLKAMSEFCEYICVVVNGSVNLEGEKSLSELSSALYIRENKGFDSWAHKYAIGKIGCDEIQKYDELIICNSTFYGPVYPLHELFDEMESRKADFWGISRYPYSEIKDVSDPGKIYKIPSHIQSYFVAFRKKVLQSPAFGEFWDTLKPVTNYEEARSFYEWRMAEFFESRGFSSSVYMDFDKYSGYKENSTILYAAKQLIEDRNPFVKIKVFDYGTDNWLREAIGHDARDVLDYIKNHTDYPFDLIYNDLIHNHRMSTLRSELHLDYSLPVDVSVTIHDAKKDKFAVILFVYYTDLVDDCIGYLKNFPEYFDIYLISSNRQLLDLYKSRMSLPNKVSYLGCENRGRDVSAYFVCGIDVFSRYDIVCCLHDKKSKQLKSMKASDEYSYQCFHNLAASRIYIESIIGLFQADSHLGMLVPPPVDFAMFACVGFELAINMNISRELYSELKLDIPFDDAPVAPFGTMFWCRGKAFSLLVDKKLKYEDFPPEPNGTDGTILHAYERLYPMIVQNAGYYVGWVMTDEYCHTYLDNLYMKVRYFNWYFAKADVYTWPRQHSYIRSRLFSDNSMSLGESLSDTETRILLRGLKFVLFKYRLLSKITFGKKRDRYRRRAQAASVLRDKLRGSSGK